MNRPFLGYRARTAQEYGPPRTETTPALDLAALVMTRDMETDIRDAFREDPINWWCGPAFRLWGIAFKNLLRSRGHDPEDYVALVERALKLR